MSEYEHVGITSPDECVRLVFEDVLPRIHLSADDHYKMVEEMNNNYNLWEATYFSQGPESGIRSLVFQSLYQKASDPRMQSSFLIGLRGQLVIVYTVHKGGQGLHPQAVWRVADRYFMLDYEQDMAPLWRFAIAKAVSREPLFYAERQREMEQEWLNNNGQLRCVKCNRTYAPEYVEAKFSKSESGEKLYALFTCPCRGIPDMASVSLGR